MGTLAYYRAVLVRGLKETWKLATVRGFAVEVAAFLAGSIAYFMRRGWSGVMDELGVFAAYVLVPVGGFAVLATIVNVIRSPALMQRDARKEISGLKARLAQAAHPFGIVSSFPLRPTKRFAQREWHLEIQNIGGVRGVFSADMEPVRGFGLKWTPPWLDTRTPEECTIDPSRSGFLVIFGDEEVGSSLVKLPVRFDPRSDTIELVGEDELNADHYGPKQEFKVTIHSDPPMPSPIVQMFRLVKGGIQRKTGNMWR